DNPWWGSAYTYDSVPNFNTYYYGQSYTNFGQGYASSGMPGYSYQSAYPSEAGDMLNAPPNTRVLATLRLPAPNARVWIEGHEMAPGGTARSFLSPPLESGQRYTYH